jgi:hypothetical protein
MDLLPKNIDLVQIPEGVVDPVRVSEVAWALPYLANINESDLLQQDFLMGLLLLGFPKEHKRNLAVLVLIRSCHHEPPKMSETMLLIL